MGARVDEDVGNFPLPRPQAISWVPEILTKSQGHPDGIQRSMILGNDQRPPSLNCPHGKGELKEMQHNDQERNAKGVRSSLHDGEVGIVTKGQDTQD